MERALSGESIHTHSDIGTSDIDTSDFDNSESEVETMSNQSAEAREADWSSDWDNQGISRQTSSQPSGATGSVRMDSELPYGLQSRAQGSSSQTTSQPSGTTGSVRMVSELPYGIQTRLETKVETQSDDDSTLKGSSSTASTVKRLAPLPPSPTKPPDPEHVPVEKTSESELIRLAAMAAQKSPEGSQGSMKTCQELVEEEEQPMENPPKETGTKLKTSNPLVQEAEKRKPTLTTEAKAKMLEGTQTQDIKITKKEKKMMDELEARINDLSNQIFGKMSTMRELFQATSEKYASTWYYEHGQMTSKLVTEWVETVNHLSTFLKKFNDVTKLKLFNELRENHEKALNQYFHKAKTMRDFMEKHEKELHDEQAAMIEEQSSMKSLDQLSQQFKMFGIDDPKIQFGQLKNQGHQVPEKKEVIQDHGGQGGSQFVQNWLNKMEHHEVQRSQPLIKRRKRSFGDVNSQSYGFRTANESFQPKYDWYQSDGRYVGFGKQIGPGHAAHVSGAARQVSEVSTKGAVVLSGTSRFGGGQSDHQIHYNEYVPPPSQGPKVQIDGQNQRDYGQLPNYGNPNLPRYVPNLVGHVPAPEMQESPMGGGRIHGGHFRMPVMKLHAPKLKENPTTEGL